MSPSRPAVTPPTTVSPATSAGASATATDGDARPVRLLILGAGGWGGQHAREYAAIDGAEVVAAVDTRPDALAAFLAEHGIRDGHASLEAALARGGFDAASNVTPDAVHHSTTLALLGAGVPVLCEKPLAPTGPLAREMAEAATASGLANAVNLRYRVVPAFAEAARIVASGAVGRVRHVEAAYLQSWLIQPAWGDWRTDPAWLWRLSTGHGSTGVLGDVGIHILDLASFVAGSDPTSISCRLKTFDKAPGGRIGEYALDANDSAVLHLELADGAIGTVTATRFAAGHRNDLYVRVYGDEGGVEARYEDRDFRLRACLGEDVLTTRWREVPTAPVPTVWERFVAAVRGGVPAEPGFRRGAEVQGWLDDAFESDRLGRRI